MYSLYMLLTYRYGYTQKMSKIIKYLNSSNSSVQLAWKLRICVTFAAIFNVELVAVLKMTLSYVRTAMIV